jgi:hypothetical protein
MQQQSLFESLETRQLFTALTMTGGPGADVFHVDNLAATDTLTIDGGGGADVVIVGGANHNAQNVKGVVTVDNPDNQIKVVIDDTNDSAARTTIFAASSFGGGVVGASIFNNGAAVTINAGNGVNDYVIEGTNGDLTINGGTAGEIFHVNHHNIGNLVLNSGGGDDFFDIGGQMTQNMDNTLAPIQINGDGNPASILNLNDSLAPMAHTYTFTPSGKSGVKLARSGSSPITINNIAISLATTAFNDKIDLSAVKQTTPCIGVSAGAGNDTILAGNGVDNSIDGGAGDDTATVDTIDPHFNIEHLTVLPSAGSIAGTLFNDTNGNGIQDKGEKGIAGRTVWLDLDNDKHLDAGEPTAITDANGNYKFSNVVAGTYVIRQKLPTGWKQTTPKNGYGIHVTLAGGQSITKELFGEKKIT